MDKKIKQVVSDINDKKTAVWGVAQVSTPSYRAEQVYFNELVNRRLDNINLCFNKRFIFKSPGIIKEFAQKPLR